MLPKNWNSGRILNEDILIFKYAKNKGMFVSLFHAFIFCRKDALCRHGHTSHVSLPLFQFTQFQPAHAFLVKLLLDLW